MVTITDPRQRASKRNEAHRMVALDTEGSASSRVSELRPRLRDGIAPKYQSLVKDRVLCQNLPWMSVLLCMTILSSCPPRCQSRSFAASGLKNSGMPRLSDAQSRHPRYAFRRRQGTVPASVNPAARLSFALGRT